MELIMDYSKLADEFLQHMYMMRKFKPQKKINESMQGETMALYHIAYHGRHIIPSEISDVTGISCARIAATLNSLEKKGYITRQIDQSDRRRILITLTEKGKQQEQESRRELIETIEKMLMQLGEHDAREYIRLTHKIAKLANVDQE